jgi:hypothetical protein
MREWRSGYFFQNMIPARLYQRGHNFPKQTIPVLSGTTGNAVVIIDGKEYSVQNSLRSGGAVVVLNSEEYPVLMEAALLLF